jgi:hypothetical protein
LESTPDEEVAMNPKRVVPLLLVLAFLFLAAAEPSEACQSVIQLDETANGTWAPSCTSLHRSGRYARYYVFTLTEATAVQIDLTSSVDPYLFLLASNGQTVLAQDDNGAGNRNARLTRSLEPGTYVIEATTDSSRRTGSFTLSLRPAGGGCLASIPLNQTVSGSWTSNCSSTHRSGRYARYYTFSLTAPTPVQIDLSSSTPTRDPYLFLLQGSGTGGLVIASDDDSGDGDSARISRTLAAGTYTVEATTFGAGQAGSFALTVRTSGGSSCSSTTPPESVVVDSWSSACASTRRGGSSARYYTFTLTAPKAMVVLLSSTTADPYLYLLEGSGANGAVIQENGVEPGKAAVLAFLRPGTYTVEAATRDRGETGSFTLTLIPFF